MNTVKNSQVAIVTGASRGIGAAVARRLASDGFAVAINYASSSKEADALVAELAAQGTKAIAIKADVANADEVRAMFEATEQQLGKIDVLVNNAGVLKTVPLADTSDALYDQTFGINVRGTFNTLREAAARMNDGGRIVNFSSTTLALNMPGYAGGRAYIEGYTILQPTFTLTAKQGYLLLNKAGAVLKYRTALAGTVADAQISPAGDAASGDAARHVRAQRVARASRERRFEGRREAGDRADRDDVCAGPEPVDRLGQDRV